MGWSTPVQEGANSSTRSPRAEENNSVSVGPVGPPPSVGEESPANTPMATP